MSHIKEVLLQLELILYFSIMFQKFRFLKRNLLLHLCLWLIKYSRLKMRFGAN